MNQYVTLQDLAYVKIRKMVHTNKFSPNKIYSQTKLAEEMEMSRTPVNSAIQKLAVEGLLDIKPSKGFSLHRLTIEDIILTYQMRCAIEGYCAMSLAKDMNSSKGITTFQPLKEILEKQRILSKSNKNYDSLASIDLNFHIKLVEHVENKLLSTLFHNHLFRAQILAKTSFSVADRRHEALEEHKLILDAIDQKDPYRAYEAVLNHLDSLKDIMIELVKGM